jgi:hypothetical protein
MKWKGLGVEEILIYCKVISQHSLEGIEVILLVVYPVRTPLQKDGHM